MGGVIVVKLDARGDEVFRYPAALVTDDGDEMVLAARWTRPSRDLGFILLEPDDRWTERFYRKRWYNVFEIRTGGGLLKGWYCNLCRPARLVDGEMRCVDLELDLFVSPSGEVLRLDEEEYHDLGLPEREPDAHCAIMAAVHELERLIAHRLPPFDGPVEPRATGRPPQAAARR